METWVYIKKGSVQIKKDRVYTAILVKWIRGVSNRVLGLHQNLRIYCVSCIYIKREQIILRFLLNGHMAVSDGDLSLCQHLSIYRIDFLPFTMKRNYGFINLVLLLKSQMCGTVVPCITASDSSSCARCGDCTEKWRCFSRHRPEGEPRGHVVSRDRLNSLQKRRYMSGIGTWYPQVSISAVDRCIEEASTSVHFSN